MFWVYQVCGARECGVVKSETEPVLLGSVDVVFEVQPKDSEVTQSSIQLILRSWVGVSVKKCIRLPSRRTGRTAACGIGVCFRTTPRPAGKRGDSAKDSAGGGE